MEKRLTIYGLSCILLLSIGLYLVLPTNKQVLYPLLPNSNLQIGINHEEIPQNWSIGTYSIDSNKLLHFKYTLSDSVVEPFTGVYFHKADSTKEQFIDFSTFNQLTIELSSTHGKRIPIFLTLDYKGFTTKGKPLSWIPLAAVIEYEGKKEYTLHKSDFEIPSWWLRYHQLKKEDFKELNFSRVTYIVVNSCQTLGPGKSDELHLSKLYFTTSTGLYYYLYVGLIFSICLGLGLFYFITKRKKVLIPYQPLEIEESDSKLDQIMKYIASNYSNPELTAGDLQLALGISEREIGTLIKTHLNTSFKAYLNTIRLTEVKRLLTESELPISEIGYLTGYNNIPHFNRVFKKEFNLTPKEFREKHKK